MSGPKMFKRSCRSEYSTVRLNRRYTTICIQSITPTTSRRYTHMHRFEKRKKKARRVLQIRRHDNSSCTQQACDGMNTGFSLIVIYQTRCPPCLSRRRVVLCLHSALLDRGLRGVSLSLPRGHSQSNIGPRHYLLEFLACLFA